MGPQREPQAHNSTKTGSQRETGGGEVGCSFTNEGVYLDEAAFASVNPRVMGFQAPIERIEGLLIVLKTKRRNGTLIQP